MFSVPQKLGYNLNDIFCPFTYPTTLSSICCFPSVYVVLLVFNSSIISIQCYQFQVCNTMIQQFCTLLSAHYVKNTFTSLTHPSTISLFSIFKSGFFFFFWSLFFFIHLFCLSNFHMNEITYCLFFLTCLIPLSIIPSGFIHVVANGKISFFFIFLNLLSTHDSEPPSLSLSPEGPLNTYSAVYTTHLALTDGLGLTDCFHREPEFPRYLGYLSIYLESKGYRISVSCLCILQLGQPAALFSAKVLLLCTSWEFMVFRINNITTSVYVLLQGRQTQCNSLLLCYH